MIMIDSLAESGLTARQLHLGADYMDRASPLYWAEVEAPITWTGLARFTRLRLT